LFVFVVYTLTIPSISSKYSERKSCGSRPVDRIPGYFYVSIFISFNFFPKIGRPTSWHVEFSSEVV